jgi:hypothetical protein
VGGFYAQDQKLLFLISGPHASINWSTVITSSSWFSRDEIQWLFKHNTQYEETSSVEGRIKTKYNWNQQGSRPLTSSDICQEIGIINPSRTELRQAGKGARLCFELGREEFSKRGSKGEKLFLMPDLKSDGRPFNQSFSFGKYGDHKE